MAVIHLLTETLVQDAGDGDHADGGGLSLRIDGANAKWVLRYTAPNGKRRAMALGTAVRSGTKRQIQASMDSARELAQEARGLLRRGLDPIELRNATKSEARQKEVAQRAEKRRQRLTLARVARDYHEQIIEPHRTAKHGAQWIASLENHVPARFWHAPIDSIEAPPLLDFFIELFGKVPETASRIIQRLRAIFGHAEFNKLRAGNPAHAAAVKLRELKLKRRRRKFAALPFAEVPKFMRDLRSREGIAARALEFAMLTAARTGEVIGATWAEFDLDAALWIVPAERMKSSGKEEPEPQTVYLSARAVEIVKAAQDYGGDFVFPTPGNPTRRLSNMAMLTLLRRMDADKKTTVHGLCRASFSTWANETNAARPDVIEARLAHREQDRVKAAYNRAKFAAERKALLVAWGDYCDRKAPTSNVIELMPKAA